ncbi:MAG: GNAT family N-acetyltransferase [Pseudomonadota bacterium]
MTTCAGLADTYAAAFPQSRAWSVGEFQTLLNTPHVQVFGTDISFAIVQSVIDAAEVITLATHPIHQKKGLAAANLALVINHGQKQGWDRIFLDVAADNHAALALYSRFDFQTVARRAGYYNRTNGQRVDGLILEKRL